MKRVADRERKRRKAKARQRPLFDIEKALIHGVVDCREPIVFYQASSIANAGNGVFAGVDIRKGDVVTIYSGERTDEKPIDGEYVVQLQDGSYITGERSPKAGNGFGSFINRSSRQKNCEFVEDEDWQKVFVVATKKIKKGAELFTTYGKSYRLKRFKSKVKLRKLLPKLW